MAAGAFFVEPGLSMCPLRDKDLDSCYVVDLEAELRRLRKELRKVEEQLSFLEGKLRNREFKAKAPAEVVEREKGRLVEQREIRAKLQESLRRLR